MHIVAMYAAVLALFFVALSVRTLRLRGRLGIAIGDGGDDAMLRAMRVHANFAEYVPLSLLLIFFVETGGANAVLVHALALCLLAGRALHAWGVSHVQEVIAFRVAGMALTFTCLIAASVQLLWLHAAYVGG